MSKKKLEKTRLDLKVKVFKNGKVIRMYLPKTKSRFFKTARSIKWEDRGFLVYVRVEYGKDVCNKGCLCTFYNDGFYDNREDLEKAVIAFMEAN